MNNSYFFHNNLVVSRGIELLFISSKKGYSEMESYIILIAFMFQIILFIIIQFFEIKTTETTNINNAKRKTK